MVLYHMACFGCQCTALWHCAGGPEQHKLPVPDQEGGSGTARRDTQAGARKTGGSGWPVWQWQVNPGCPPAAPLRPRLWSGALYLCFRV